MWRLRLVVLALAAVALVILVFIGLWRGRDDSEAGLQSRLCRGMSLEFALPDRTRIDCLSGTHAIEVDFWDNWYEAIGQSLHYALGTAELTSIGSRRAGVILVCRRSPEMCSEHAARLFRVIGEYRLPITVWNCELTARALADCRATEPP
jgi:hypothetical protein